MNVLHKDAFGGEEPVVGVVVVFRSRTGLKICGMGLSNISVQIRPLICCCSILRPSPKALEILKHDFQPEVAHTLAVVL